MKLLRSKSGISLIEVLIYISLMEIILLISLVTWHECQANNTNLQRCSSDILKTMEIGERWRSDIRNAKTPPSLGRDGTLKIPSKSGLIIYRFKDGILWRTSPKGGNPIPILRGIKNSKMVKDPRNHVVSWRWEVELLSFNSKSRLHPLFTFQTVSPP